MKTVTKIQGLTVLIIASLFLTSASPLFAILCVAALASFAYMQCPRCGTHVRAIKGFELGHFASPIDACCYKCGRSHERVWPFQYYLKREPWDGQYHGPET